MKSTLSCLALCLLLPSGLIFAQDAPNAEYPDFYSGASDLKDKEKGIEWVQAISVTDPAYCSAIKGDVTVSFKAPGMTKVKALCWQQPTAANPSKWGHDQLIDGNILLDGEGNGSFTFPADNFPNGPITIRIYAKDNGAKQDLCELQLFNKGGKKWDQGIPQTDPPAAEGMKLAFSDDFSGPLSISNNGIGARYEAHKTHGGDFSGWPFTNYQDASDPDKKLDPMNPFSQVGTWLRIHASKNAAGQSSSGILSSAHEDGGGFYAAAPCYFECRFMAQSAPGTWPAWWLLSKPDPAVPKGCDELDIIEGYGGKGPHNPNWNGYAITSHYWDEVGPSGFKLNDDHTSVSMMDLGGKSTWSTTFHTYAVKIMPDEIIYYFDDIEVFRHKNVGLSQTRPLWFLVNYAIGGISQWPIDLERYGNQTDMWVDYIRVYQGAKATEAPAAAPTPAAAPAPAQ